MTGRLVVSEVFGPTFQGEGPSAGRRAGFVRLGRCNLDCGWCDSRYTWDWEAHDPAVELHRVTTAAILEQLDAMQVDLVVVTGGEPLLQRSHLAPLLEGCRDRSWRVEVETNGTIRPDGLDGLVSQWNVSPKLANSGIVPSRRYLPPVLEAFERTDRAVFKFVVAAPSELDEVATVVAECGLSTVYVMPEGTDAGTVTDRLRDLAGPVLARGWHLTPRLHILVWGDRRGV